MWLEEHLRHSRGYGVHSPLLYRIVREAMMPRRVKGYDTSLYDALRARGVDRRTATRLQNLLCVEGYGRWSIDAVAGKGEMMIASADCREEQLRAMASVLREQEGILCILHPIGNRTRRRVCRAMVAEHHSMSASKPTFTLLISRQDLQKQHIII